MPRIFQVDAFTDQPFRGNPAAVCLLDGPADSHWMQNVAAEMNLAETAFVFRNGDRFNLRWFTPLAEVELCGHATLATSNVLWENGIVQNSDPCVYQTLSGELRANRSGNEIQLDFPSAPPNQRAAPAGLLASLNIESPKYVGFGRFDFLVEIESAQAVREMNPNMSELRKLGSRGVIVTAKDDSGNFDFISRFFAPGIGIDEDPVTGSAHCTLGPYWQSKLGKSQLRAFQASPRGGELNVAIVGDRVKLLGSAVTVLRGELLC